MLLKAAQDKMVRQHHQLNGRESEQTPGDSVGQGSLACCSPWGPKESDTTYNSKSLSCPGAVVWGFQLHKETENKIF